MSRVYRPSAHSLLLDTVHGLIQKDVRRRFAAWPWILGFLISLVDHSAKLVGSFPEQSSPSRELHVQSCWLGHNSLLFHPLKIPFLLPMVYCIVQSFLHDFALMQWLMISYKDWQCLLTWLIALAHSTLGTPWFESDMILNFLVTRKN